MTKVLIISHDIKLAKVLDYNLTHDGYVVNVVPSRELAIKKMEEIYFGLVLFDFQSDEDIRTYSGLQGNADKVPVVAMGESFHEVFILEKMYKGLDDYVLKPFRMSELKMIINKQLERKKLMSKRATASRLSLLSGSDMDIL